MLLNQTRALRIMNRLGLDALVATSPENVMYASDYECLTHWINKGAQVYALLTPGHDPDAALIAPRLELEAIVDSNVWIDDVYLVGAFGRSYTYAEGMDETGRRAKALADRAHPAETAVQALVESLRVRGLERGRIGLDETGMSAPIWAQIAQALPKAEIIPAGNTWWEIRIIKTDEELRRIREATRITELAFNAALELAKPGARDRDIVRVFHQQLTANDAMPAFSCFGSGPRSAFPHILPGDRAMEEGDVLRFDIGALYGYYYSDTARSVVLGTPTAQQQRIWDAMVAGEEAALALIRPGADPAELFRAAMEPGWAAGFSDYMRVHTGHGIGINVYDPPVISDLDPTKSIYLMPVAEGGLAENMVINIETGYYLQGFGGFQCEDTVIVTATGSELLTHNSKQLALADYLADR